MRHLFRLHHLAADPGIGRTAANGEVVGGRDDRATIDQRLAEEERGGGNALEIAVLVVVTLAGDLADFAEATLVAQRGEPRARIHLAARMLPRDLLRAAHLFGERLALAQFLEFLRPGHRPAIAASPFSREMTGV